MYEVNINAHPDQFLDWDRPLSAQPTIRDALPQDLLDNLRQHGTKSKSDWGDLGVGTNPADYATGQSLYNTVASKDALAMDPLRIVGIDKPAATEFFKERGIPGIKYLDQGSRAAGDGSRNYVVFDDKLIDILRKYGILGPVAAGAMYSGNEAQAAA